MKLADMKMRSCDVHGCGHFGASRGSRTHMGIDLECNPGVDILSPIDGVVSKIGFPYADPNKNFIRYVEITKADYKFRFFYVSPSVEVGDDIKVDDIIGESQCLGQFYPGITEHIHFEVKNPKGIRIDPTIAYLSML